jgi:mRNA interferase MazF
MVALTEIAPARGDIVWITLHPQAGHEQAGRRPAVVLSPLSYNEKVGLALFCPITSAVKGYPWEVVLPPGMSVSGVALADQIKSLDWRSRKAERVCSLAPHTVAEILGKLNVLLSI